MTQTIRPARTETFEHTMSGLLTKRADLLGEAVTLRDRIAEIRNDVAAIDRVLGTLGYKGDLDAAMPRQKREVIFGKGELTRAVLNELRETGEAMTSRQIAQAIVSLRGDDARDRKYMAQVTNRISKALRVQRLNGVVASAVDANGNALWRVRNAT
jgi:hypothetical protein